MCAERGNGRLWTDDQAAGLHAQWVLPADPCAVCVAFALSVSTGAALVRARGAASDERLRARLAAAFAIPHACALTLTRAAISFAVAEPDAVTVAFPVAFARALRAA